MSKDREYKAYRKRIKERMERYISKLAKDIGLDIIKRLSSREGIKKPEVWFRITYKGEGAFRWSKDSGYDDVLLTRVNYTGPTIILHKNLPKVVDLARKLDIDKEKWMKFWKETVAHEWYHYKQFREGVYFKDVPPDTIENAAARFGADFIDMTEKEARELRIEMRSRFEIIDGAYENREVPTLEEAVKRWGGEVS